MIEALGNDHDESNNAAIECCLLIGNQGKELDHKYEQLVCENNFQSILIRSYFYSGWIITNYTGEIQRTATTFNDDFR